MVFAAVTLLLQCESSDKHYLIEWVWLCSDKTLFIETFSVLDLA